MNCRSLRRAAAAWLLGACVGLAACGGEAPAAAPQGPNDPLLVVDGLTITFGEVDPHVDWLQKLAPELSRRALRRSVLDEFVLPLRLAQRAFAEPREKQRAAAEALCAVATNVAELEAQTKLHGSALLHQRKVVARRQVEPPVREFLFDPLHVGAVSGPLEVPRGYLVAGCFELREAALVLDDLADALQVGFVTHTTTEWRDWLEQERTRVADTVTFVHPDHREAIPQWLKLP